MKNRLTLIQSQNRSLAGRESLCLQGQTKKRKRSKHVQSFVDEWLADKQFKEWLSKRVGKESKPQPYCKYCQKFVTCTKTGLKRHSTSNIHQKNTKDTSVAGTLTSYFTKSATRDETSSMEIKLCAFIAEHNLPISLSDDFIALLKSMFPLNNTLKNVTLCDAILARKFSAKKGNSQGVEGILVLQLWKHCYILV